MLGNIFSGRGQSKDDSPKLINRKACVAGQFYPDNSKKLSQELQGYFEFAKPRTDEDLRAIISPHAGYVYSGQVAASSFNQINPTKKYDRIFVIGSSHRVYFDGVSVYNLGNYETPLGKVQVDRKTATKLINEHTVFEYREDAHLTEHSLEVQLPFLQYHMKTDFEIVPIIIATQSESSIKKIADALAPYFNPHNLFVISSDFSHYPNYEQANDVDRLTADAIVSNSPSIFMETLAQNEKDRIPGLSTSMCGWSSMMAILNITSQKENIRYNTIDYKNSGDAAFGDKNRVVGYWAMSITEDSDEENIFELTDADKKTLLHHARLAIEDYVQNKNSPEINTQNLSEVLLEPAGAFVSLQLNGNLRGCVGRFNPDKPLYSVVQNMAISAATRDSRFDPITSKELDKINIEISVLTPIQKIDSIDQIQMGQHGIYIKKGNNTGTFLPQVAESTDWSLEEFLGHCSKNKAHIGWDGWRLADIYTYETITFDEMDFR